MTWVGKAQGRWTSMHGLRCGGKKASRKCVRLRWGRAPWIRGSYSEVGPKSEEGHRRSLERVPATRKPRGGVNYEAGALNQ